MTKQNDNWEEYWPTYIVPHICVRVFGEDKHGNRYEGEKIDIRTKKAEWEAEARKEVLYDVRVKLNTICKPDDWGSWSIERQIGFDLAWGDVVDTFDAIQSTPPNKQTNE